MFVVKGGYKTVCKSLRNRGWVDGEYYLRKSNTGQQHHTMKDRIEQSKYGSNIEKDEQDNDDSDSDVDEESESDEEKEDEEEYVMLVRENTCM